MYIVQLLKQVVMMHVDLILFKTTQTVWSVADSSWVETSVAGEAATALAVVALTYKRKVAKSSIISYIFLVDQNLWLSSFSLTFSVFTNFSHHNSLGIKHCSSTSTKVDSFLYVCGT